MGPLLTLKVHEALQAAAASGTHSVQCSLNLGRTQTQVELAAAHWSTDGSQYPYLSSCKDRTIYYWTGSEFQPVSRYTGALVKLVPTDWGPPTFEIDGIKMLPTLQLSPYTDAERKVGLISPRGKTILDTCGGLGYFAACCLQGGAARICSYEKNADVIWLRTLNPWSPGVDPRLNLANEDVSSVISELPAAHFDAVLHDPPRFGIAGELYSQAFYEQLARVLKPKGLMFHYTGTPNKLTSGRDVPNEVANRLRIAGFTTQLHGDGVLAMRGRSR
jgi:predicted methyltransferase